MAVAFWLVFLVLHLPVLWSIFYPAATWIVLRKCKSNHVILQLKMVSHNINNKSRCITLACKTLNTWPMIVYAISFPATHWSLTTLASWCFPNMLCLFPSQGLCTCFYSCLEFLLPDICRACSLPANRSLFKYHYLSHCFIIQPPCFIFFNPVLFIPGYLALFNIISMYVQFFCSPTMCQFYISRNLCALFTVISPMFRPVAGMYQLLTKYLLNTWWM